MYLDNLFYYNSSHFLSLSPRLYVFENHFKTEIFSFAFDTFIFQVQNFASQTDSPADCLPKVVDPKIYSSLKKENPLSGMFADGCFHTLEVSPMSRDREHCNRRPLLLRAL